jgi:hypothetical protein
MALMFDVKVTYIYRHLFWRFTLQFMIADRGVTIIKISMLTTKEVSELARFH